MSAMVNVLYLTRSFFMLEIYDRVVPSRSVPTLIGLLILAAGRYTAPGTLNLIRGRILVRIGASERSSAVMSAARAARFSFTIREFDVAEDSRVQEPGGA
jgi:ABC-type protease/lipase transport system fused ATPase/permease subunit